MRECGYRGGAEKGEQSHCEGGEGEREKYQMSVGAMLSSLHLALSLVRRRNERV